MFARPAGTAFRMPSRCVASKLVSPEAPSPSRCTRSPSNAIIRGVTKLSSDDADVRLRPAYSLSHAVIEPTSLPNSNERRLLPSSVNGEVDGSLESTLLGLLRTPGSLARFVSRLMICPMVPGSLDFCANPERMRGQAAPSAFETAPSDSPSLDAAAPRSSGVRRPLHASSRLVVIRPPSFLCSRYQPQSRDCDGISADIVPPYGLNCMPIRNRQEPPSGRARPIIGGSVGFADP